MAELTEEQRAAKRDRDKRYREKKRKEKEAADKVVDLAGRRAAKDTAVKKAAKKATAKKDKDAGLTKPPVEQVAGDVLPPEGGTPEEVAARHAYEVEQRIKGVVWQLRAAWATLARDLYEFSNASLWRDLGYDSFEEWLAGPDIEIGRRWCYELISVYREFVVKREVPLESLAEIEPSKLQEILPAIRRDQVNLETALSDAKALSKSDIRERYGSGGAGTTQTARGSAPDTGTGYDAGHEPAMVICPTCGHRVREEDIRRDE